MSTFGIPFTRLLRKGLISQQLVGGIKIFCFLSRPCEFAQILGKHVRLAENKGKIALSKVSPQSYPQKWWTKSLLPRPLLRCSDGSRIDGSEIDLSRLVMWS
ncbi:hypothetical protein HOY34_01005 [Xinfangfangia sp. D13-10-4-6]|uniref:hypothetical protein n=1 Tax=Pseudogemmobacter hezensis TaxID=2737662 RepID=UPI001557D016|nr:hypothetical protein [Pseudogemmobacter hezensis]NPD13777.1 hypothetical protein [Pseudogemmobacter hezensis]